MKALLIPAAIVTALVSIPAAHAEDGESSLRFFNKERAKAQAVGGYGNPPCRSAVRDGRKSLGNGRCHDR